MNQEVNINVFQQVEHKDTVLNYNAADVVILTSKWEGSPNAIKEALACCRPIVSTNVGDVKTRIDGVVGCCVTKTRNPQEFADAIVQAFNYKACIGGRETLHAAGLDSKHIANQVISTYRENL